MKRILKKSMSIFLAFTLLFGSLAFGFSDVDWAEFAVKASAEPATSGTCGDNLTWTFDEGTGTLTISGTGDMYDFTSFSYGIAPWNSNRSEIKSISISNSVTSIGDYAFTYFDSLTSITIPDSVTSIGDGAFEFCGSLTSVFIPNNVTNMGKAPFCGCAVLSNIMVDSENPSYVNDEYGVLFNKDRSDLIQYPIGNDREIYSIPDSVINIKDSAFFASDLSNIIIPDKLENIGNSAFMNSEITEILIPSSVTFIGDEAFMGCSFLSDLIIPNSIINIGDRAFAECGFTNIIIPQSVKKIGDFAFGRCNALTNIFVDSANTNYSSDENGVLFNKDKTELIQYPIRNERRSYIIPDCVVKICDRAFLESYYLNKITIGHGVRYIGNNAFSDCYALDEITVFDGITSIGDDILTNTSFYSDSSNWRNDALYLEDYLIDVNLSCRGSYSVLDGTKVISSCAFFGLSHITQIKLPDSLTNIGRFAFKHCEGITELIIPDSVVNIEESTFENCYNLKNVTLGNAMTSINDNLFLNCFGLECILLPDSITRIGDGSFQGCDKLKIVNYEGSKEEWSKVSIGKENEELLNATIYFAKNDSFATPSDPKPFEPILPPVIEITKPSTIQPVVTEPSTAKPVEITKPTTEPTKPVVTEPSTTKPVEVPTTVPTTKPVEITKPTTESTTKPVVEEEIIKKPSTSTVKYGETLILHADFENIPDGAKIEWSVEGKGVTIVPSEDGKTCAVTSTATGDVTITAKYVDTNGVEHVSEQEIKSNASFWQKIVSFFKNLFNINRIIEQIIKF